MKKRILEEIEKEFPQVQRSESLKIMKIFHNTLTLENYYVY